MVIKMGNPDEKLTKAITEINEDDASIDTFSDFPTKEAIDIQLYNRMLAKTMDLAYYEHEADFISEMMRGFKRKARQEVVLSLYKDIQMYNSMVEPFGTKPEKE
jgi:tRNA A-37 threonylcarbamoyl transferase component Bud32